MNDMNNFIDAVVQKDYTSANNMFAELMGQKIDTALDAEKINVASQVFNNLEAEDDDISDEDLEELADNAADEEELNASDYAEDEESIQDDEEELESFETEEDFENV